LNHESKKYLINTIRAEIKKKIDKKKRLVKFKQEKKIKIPCKTKRSRKVSFKSTIDKISYENNDLHEGLQSMIAVIPSKNYDLPPSNLSELYELFHMSEFTEEEIELTKEDVEFIKC
jgi:hypothetical protein